MYSQPLTSVTLYKETYNVEVSRFLNKGTNDQQIKNELNIKRIH